MLLTGIHAHDFLSFRLFDLSLEPALMTITGPNGVGKTNVGRCLDLVRAVLDHHTGKQATEQVELYQSAGHNGATSFTVSLNMELDQDWEKTLLARFSRAAFACGDAAASDDWAADLDTEARARLEENSLAPLWIGTLKVWFDASMRRPWWASWEFDHAGKKWHIPLIGIGRPDFLHPGNAEPFTSSELTQTSFTRFMLSVANNASIEELRSVARLLEKFNLDTALEKSSNQLANWCVPPLLSGSKPIPASLRELAADLEVGRIENRTFTFSEVFAKILRHSLVLTDNRRIPPRRHFNHSDLKPPIDLRDGGNVAARLFQLKNGTAEDRELYTRIEQTFSSLTNRTFGLRTTITDSGDGDGDDITIEPTIVTNNGERPIEFSGAGIQEALVLSTLLCGSPGRVFVLDEPAVNLEPTMQRRLISALRDAGQSLVITHSPDMVPISGPNDLAGIVRLAPRADGPVVSRARTLAPADRARWVQLLEPTHVRGLLFSARVILCEGSTETGALPQWWRDTADLGIPDPEAANMPIISVDSDSRFGIYIDYLDAFEVPWAIVADGPALRYDSHLAQHLEKRGYSPPNTPTGQDFGKWRHHWSKVGVFTLANQFGNDGSKQGEFEAFLERVDSGLLARAKAQSGRSKPRCGAYFATNYPRPQEVTDLYIAIMRHFKI